MNSENKMGVMPVKKLIISMSLPMMASMLVQALYNIVDSMYVSRISLDALTAVTLAFPLQNLVIAFGAGTGVGMNAILSKALGERNFKTSNDAAKTGLQLILVNYFLFLLIGLFFAKSFIATQTTIPYILESGTDYLRIVTCFSFGVFCQMTFERLLQSTGQTLYSMYSQMSGAIINIILDPILIFGYFGLPALGVKGAAIATVIGQCFAAVIGWHLNVTRNTEIDFHQNVLDKIDFSMIKRIYEIGIPSILMMSIGSLMTYLMNLILIVFSTTATAVFGAYFRLQSFFFMPVFGMNNGVVPVLAYNYGAKNKERINEALRFAIVLAMGIMLAGTLIMQLFPDKLLSFFDANEEMLRTGVPALRIISIHFPVAAVGISLGSTFQAFGKGNYSLMTSIARQLVVLIPTAWLLAQTGNVNNVWYSFFIAEVVSMLVSIYFFKKLYTKLVAPL